MNQKKPSPWVEFKRWMTDYQQSELDESVLKAMNPYTVLCMFCNMNEATIFLNEYFNNFGSMKLDKKEFFLFLKYRIVWKFGLQYNDFSFISMKRNKSLNDLRSKLPLLKEYEIAHILERIDETDEKPFLDFLGLEKYKVEKRKAVKKDSKKIATVEDWFSLFRT